MKATEKKTFNKIKNEYPNVLLLFRVDDRYAAYFDDADVIVKTIGLYAWTDEDGDKQTSFSCHLLDAVLPRLVRAGHKVAICDEL